jgi:hypothetical protein
VTKFIVHLTPTADCTDPIKALRELLKRALRSWGLRCVYVAEEISAHPVRDAAAEAEIDCKPSGADCSRQTLLRADF